MFPRALILGRQRPYRSSIRMSSGSALVDLFADVLVLLTTRQVGGDTTTGAGHIGGTGRDIDETEDEATEVTAVELGEEGVEGTVPDEVIVLDIIELRFAVLAVGSDSEAEQVRVLHDLTGFEGGLVGAVPGLGRRDLGKRSMSQDRSGVNVGVFKSPYVGKLGGKRAGVLGGQRTGIALCYSSVLPGRLLANEDKIIRAQITNI